MLPRAETGQAQGKQRQTQSVSTRSDRRGAARGKRGRGPGHTRAGIRKGVQRKTPSGGGVRRRAPTKKSMFSGLGACDGCAVSVTAGERVDGRWDRAAESCEVKLTLKSGSGRGVGGLTRRLPAVCRALAAAGHVQRAQIMAKLLEGPGTYRSLQRVTKLKAGPLYHHINQLRLAGLILPKQRDLYELTRGGRNLILGAMALAPLIRDRRRRPVAVGP